MPIQIGDQPERVSRLEKFAPWLRRILIGGCLVWASVSIQNYYEDTVSHTIKETYPLLMGHERITSLTPAYDPRKARWKPVETAVPVADDQIFFIKTASGIYAVKISDQQSAPEKGEYEYLKVGDTAPAVKAVTGEYPGGITLPDCKVGWSGPVKRPGIGFLYLDNGFIWNKPPPFKIGVPFQTGNLESYRNKIPANIHFESVPWKIQNSDDDLIIPAQ